MTNLTEKWNKGELPEGMYYFKLPNGETMAGTDYCLATYLLTKDSNRCEVLAEVPSYDGYMTLIRAYNNVVDENEQLKELLGRANDIIKTGIVTRFDANITQQIDEVLGEE